MAGLFSSKKAKKGKEEKAAAAKNAAAMAAAAAAAANPNNNNLGPMTGGNGSIASSTTMAPSPNSGSKQQLNNMGPSGSPVTTTLAMTPASSFTSSSAPAHLRENSSNSLDYSSSLQQQQQQQQVPSKSSVESGDKRMYHIQQQQLQYQHQLPYHQQQQQQQQQQSSINGGGANSNLVSASSISTHNSFAHLSSTNGPWISAQVMSTSPFPRFSHTASYVQTGTDIYVFGGVVKGSAQRDMHVIDSQSLHCQVLPVGGNDSPPSTSGHTAVTLGHYIMYFGGKDAKNKCSDALYVLHTIRKEWNKPTILGLLPAPRHSHAACVIGTTMYIFGGQFNGYYLNDIASFDMKSLNTPNPRWNRLEPASELPPARAGHCAAAHDDKIYIFGGADDQFFYNDIWCYDPQLNKWEAVPAFGVLPTSRQGHASSVVDDTMYIYGGMNHEDQLLGDLSAFKFNDRRWLTFPDTVDSASPRTEHAMCTVGDRIYIMGGQLELNAEDDGSIYILDTTKIRYHEPSLGPRSGYDNDSGLRVDAALDDPNSSFQRPTPSPDSIRHSNDVNHDSRRALQQQPQQQQQQVISPEEQYVHQQNAHPSARFVDESNMGSSHTQTRVSLDAADVSQVSRRRTVGKLVNNPIHEVEPRGTQSIDETRRPNKADQDYYERDPIRSQNQRPIQPLQYNNAQYANLQQSQQQQQQSQQQSQDAGRRRSLTENKNRGSLNPPPRASLDQSRAPSSQPSQDSVSPLSSQEIQYNSQDAEIRDLKQREQWLLAEVAMARKKMGERPLSMTLALKDGLGSFDAERDSEKYKIMQVLLSCKAELERSKSSIVAQAQVASNKLREAERIRTAALQEAAYLKAKVSALQSGEVSALVSTETARAVDLEKRLTVALSQVDKLQSQQAQHEALLERERHARETAQERARQASAAAEEAQQARTRSLADMTSLHERASVAEASLREVEAKNASSEARLSSYQQQSTALFSQISGLKTTVDHQKKSLEKAKLAYSVANDRAEHADRLWTQARQEIDHSQMELASARADYERAQREAEHWKTKAQETDLLWQKAKSENEAMRTLLEEDMNASFSPGANSRKHDSIMAITSASRVAELEHELGTLRHLLRDSQAAAAQANKDLGESMLRISQLEQTSMAARTEAVDAQRQLSGAEDRVASLEAQLNQKEESLEEMAKEQENNEVQLGVLRGVMRENGLLADDLILDALSQGPGSPTNGPVTMTGLKTKVQEAEKLAQEAKQQLEEMSTLKKHQEERIQQLEADYQTAVHYVQGSETMVQRLRDEAQSAKAEKEAIQKSLQELEVAHGQAREVHASAGQATAAATNQLEEEVTDLHRQLHDSMGRSMELEKKMEELTRALQDSEAQVEVSQIELKTLKSKHHEHKKQGAISTENFKAKIEELENALEETQASLAETRHQLELTQYELEQSHALNTSTGRELEEALAAVKVHQEALANQQQVAADALGHSETMSEEALEAGRKRAEALAAHQEELELVIESAQKTIQTLQVTNQDLEQQLRASENKISILLDNFQGPDSVRNSMASLGGSDDLIQRLMEASHHSVRSSYLTPMSHGSHLTDRSSADSLANELELLRSNWGQAQLNGAPYRPPVVAVGNDNGTAPTVSAEGVKSPETEGEQHAVEGVHAITTTTTAPTATTTTTTTSGTPLSPMSPQSPTANKNTLATPENKIVSSSSSTSAPGNSSSSSASAQKLEEYEQMIEDMAHQRRQYEE